MIVEGEGGPLGVVVAGANVHDTKLLDATIEAMVVPRPDPELNEQHLCLDKGFDNPTGHAAAENGCYSMNSSRLSDDTKVRLKLPWRCSITCDWRSR